MPMLGEIEARTIGCKTREEELKMKGYFFEVMGYDFRHDENDPDERKRGTTRRFHQSEAKIRIQSAPARSSKSTSAAAEVFASSMPTEPRTSNLNFIVGVDYKTNKEFEYIWQHAIDNRERWASVYRVLRAVNWPEPTA